MVNRKRLRKRGLGKGLFVPAKAPGLVPVGLGLTGVDDQPVGGKAIYEMEDTSIAEMPDTSLIAGDSGEESASDEDSAV
jgi:hypothetical protein